MIRLVFALFALVLPVGAWAQVGDQANGDPVVITGVVQEQSAVHEPIGDVSGYSQSIKLIAWRQDNGPISTQAMWLHIKRKTGEEFDTLQISFSEGQTVRFETAGPLTLHGPNEDAKSVQAKFGRLIGPVEDAELLAAAQKVWRPEAFTDAELGEFEPHSRLYDHFGQVREWLGKKTVFEVILEPMGPRARERALTMSRMVWNDHAEVDETIRETITDHIYSNVNTNLDVKLVPLDGGEPITKVTEDDLPPLTRDAFKTNHRLVRVSCSAQDYCSLEYVAQGIDWYWTYYATIRRKDAEDGTPGWHLDEWDFP